MSDLTPDVLAKLRAAAESAATRAYAPYSHFPVGVALLADDGSIHTGCNVENAAYPLCICAEQGAVAGMVAQGCRHIKAVVIYTPTPTPTAPCGGCRQVLHQFGPGASVQCYCDGDSVLRVKLNDLLPEAFELGSGH